MFDFDTMLIALNYYQDMDGDGEKLAVPAAAEKDMGILAMKLIRPKEAVEDVAVEDLIRYALSLDQFHAAAIGTDRMDVLEKNVALLRSFTPMTSAEMRHVHLKLAPAFRRGEMPWLRPGYTDGSSV